MTKLPKALRVFHQSASDSDMIFDDIDFILFSQFVILVFRHFSISSFRCLNTPLKISLVPLGISLQLACNDP